MPDLLKWNDDLMGAPAGVLIAIFAVALGYFLKRLPTFDNRYIPAVVVLTCTLGFMLLSPKRAPDMELRIWLTRNAIIGFIIGFAAWAAHSQILRRFIDPKLFKTGDTQFLDKPVTPPTQNNNNTNEKP